MTELDAAILAEQDAHRAHQRISVGALPKDVGKLVMTTLVARIDGFSVDRASEVARAAARTSLETSTFAENLLTRCGLVTHAAVRNLVPEDGRALIVWLVGREAGDAGFLHPIVEMIAESSGPPALAQLSEELASLVARMNEADRVLFQERVKSLGRAKQDIIRGLRMDAHWSLHEGDGLAVRDLLVQARQMALKWLKEDQTARAAGFEPFPEA